MTLFSFARERATMISMELKAVPRTELKRRVKTLRKNGFLPAVLYGPDTETQPLAVVYKDFERAYQEAGESTLLTLEVDGKSYNVLINDIAHDPLRGNPIHADFYAVRMDKLIRTMVPLEFFGESDAVKNESGVLVKVRQELEIEALPRDLPREIRADLSSLTKLESRILVRDLLLPQGVKIFAHTEEVVALVETPRSPEELETMAQAAPAVEGVKEVQTEQELKRAAKAEGQETSEESPAAGGEGK